MTHAAAASGGRCLAGFDWWPGKRWRHGRYDSKEVCEVGGCSDDLLLELGATREECTARSGCSAPCTYCASDYAVYQVRAAPTSVSRD